MSTDLIAEYQSGAQRLADAVAGMTAQQLAAHPVSGKWSTLEVVCHLADMEGVFCDRMKWVIAEEAPPLLKADEPLWTRRLGYEARNVADELAVMTALRRQMATILRQVPAADWQARAFTARRAG